MLPFYEIQPNSLTIIHNARELYFPSHMHEYIEILYTFSGVQCLTIDGISYQIHEGEAVVIFPDIVHSYYKSGNNSTDAVLIICDPQILGGLFPSLHNCYAKNPVIPKEAIHTDAVYALKHISRNDEVALKLGWTYVIMSHLLNQLELKQRHRIPVQDIAHKIIEYIAVNFTQPLTLDSLAAEFCVSKYYISHIFSSRMKMNFRVYLGFIRTEYAAKLIRTTNDTLTEISITAGFDSQRTFNRIFHSIFGMTPSQYRHNINTHTK